MGEQISLAKAKPNKLFYVVATAVVYREADGRCLILRRSERETVHPGKWSVPGGKLEWGDLELRRSHAANDHLEWDPGVLKRLVKREVKEEAGLEINDEIRHIDDLVFIRPDGIPVMLMKFAVRYKSGEVKLEQNAFTDSAWINETELENYSCIGGVPEEIRAAIRIFSNA